MPVAAMTEAMRAFFAPRSAMTFDISMAPSWMTSSTAGALTHCVIANQSRGKPDWARSPKSNYYNKSQFPPMLIRRASGVIKGFLIAAALVTDEGYNLHVGALELDPRGAVL